MNAIVATELLSRSEEADSFLSQSLSFKT